jgi:hypothetical protein
MIDFLHAVLVHTPTRVWILLAVLVAVGLRQTAPRRVSASRVLMLPVAIGLLSLSSAWNAFGAAGAVETPLAWALGAVIGLAGGRALALPQGVVAHADGSFELPGSIVPLLVMLGVFALRYVVNVALAVSPGLAAQAAFAIAASAAYGAPVGLLAARARRVWAARAASGRPAAA